MSKISISSHFHNHRTFARYAPVSCESCCFSYGKNIHTVDPYARNILRTSIKIRICTCTCRTRAHTVAIVFANEYARQRPEFSHVISFKDLTLISGAIAVQSNANIWFATIFMCESNLKDFVRLKCFLY